MSTILIFTVGILLTIFIIIGFHEFGHYLVAKLVGVRVLRFSLGFGKILFSKTDRTGTQFAISAIPLGGYVQMLDEDEGIVAESDKNFAFNRQAFWKKFLIIAAGPLFNLILALILYWFIFMIGFNSVSPVIGKTTPNSIAAKANLQAKDEIIKIDNIPVASWMSVIIRIISHTGNKDKLTITTRSTSGNVTTHLLDLTTWKMDDLKPDPLGSLGIKIFEPTKEELKKYIHHNQYGPILAFSHAWQNTKDFTWLNLDFMGKLFTGKVSLQSLGGPISIFSGAGEALKDGAIAFMSFLAFISIAIGVVNILPIPGLDGGHLLFKSIEAILGRPIPERILLLFYRIGFALIILLSIRAIANDILRL